VPKRDPNQQADDNTRIVRAVEKITGSEPVRGEDLLSSEELKRKFRAASAAEMLTPSEIKALRKDSRDALEQSIQWLTRRSKTT
jgi:hypothetical protein